MRRDRSARPWHLYLLGVAAIAVVVLAIVEIGPPSSSARTSREVVTAAAGVVQSTVTGSGNLQAGTDMDVNFKTSGTLADVYVSVGQHVTQGQLLAELDPTPEQLALDQAEENLTAAQDQLTAVRDGTATGSAGSSAAATNASLSDPSSSTVEFVSDIHRKPPTSTATSPTTTTTSPTRTTTSPTRTTTTPTRTTTAPTRTTTTPTRTTTAPTTTTPSSSSATPSSSGVGSGRAFGPSGSGSSRSSGSGSSPSSSSSSPDSSSSKTTTTTTPSPASIASAQASVYSAEASVDSAEQALNNTKLYAPASGTIVSLASLSPGDSVSAGSTGTASSSSSSDESSSSGGGGLAGGSSTAGSLGGSSSSSSGSSSGGSSSPFAEIVNTGTMTMTVALSESDINKVHVGQSATITPDALSGVELAASVTQIAPVGTTSSGVVSYNTTLTLDQSDSQVKPGMSASASIIVSQAQGVTLPNQAVTGTGSLGTVNMLQNGKTVRHQVIVGLRGDSRTQIVSGLSAGQQVVVTISLPSLSQSTSTSSSSGALGGAASRFGGAGGAAGGGFLGGGGGGIRRAFGGGG